MKKVSVSIIGYGGRGSLYATYQTKYPNEMDIVAVVDINPLALERAKKEHNLSNDKLFSSFEDFVARGKISDVALICTCDQDHYKHSIPLLKMGYDLLLEKPISNNLDECKKIADCAKQNNRHVSVAHVLRYTPFYAKIKEIIDSGKIGKVVNINQVENVGYWHYAHSFVRGNWNNSETTAPMILAKCCHDIDMILYLSGEHCKSVSSFGSLKYFNKKNAPEGSAERCFECKNKSTCVYEAERCYIKEGLNGGHAWIPYYVNPLPTEENLKEGLKTSPYGKCVYQSDNNVVDHQVVNFNLTNEITATLTMCAFSNDCYRTTKIFGTKGEIIGKMEDKLLEVNVFGGETEIIDLNKLDLDFSGHGGGDMNLMRDFLISSYNREYKNRTDIDKSVESHTIAFSAEESRINEGKVIKII